MGGIGFVLDRHRNGGRRSVFGSVGAWRKTLSSLEASRRNSKRMMNGIGGKK
jgi:hypothetical protein